VDATSEERELSSLEMKVSALIPSLNDSLEAPLMNHTMVKSTYQ